MAIKVNPVNFVLAQNSAVVLYPATAEVLNIRGLQGMGLLLGFTMDTQDVSEMGRRIALVVPSGGKYEPASVNYNFIPGDRSLEIFRDAAINSTLLKKIRLYVKQGCDFTAPDLISDPGAGLYVGTMGDPKVDSPNGLWQGSLEYMAGGAFVLYIAHTGNDGTTLNYTAATRTLTDSGNGFVAKGFEAGDTCLLDWDGVNEPLNLQIETVAAGAIVFAEGVGDEATLADFSGATATQLHSATPLVVSGFSGLAECD